MSFFKINKIVVGLVTVILLASCGTTHKIKNELKQDAKESSFFKGFVLYNPATQKEVINQNGAKYFTPASNTKLYTFYTAFKTLKDSVTSLAYYQTNDSLIIKGTADPTLLYYGNDSTKVIDFLKKAPQAIYMVDAAIDETPYGSGWAWDDYQEYYMPDKSLFPIYGNLLRYKQMADTIQSTPTYFKKAITVLDSISLTRDLNENQFYLEKGKTSTYEVPFKTSNQLVATLLSEQLGKPVTLIKNTSKYTYQYLSGMSLDELYKQFLKVSDNFFGEQLLLQVSKTVNDTYNVQEAIRYSLTNYLSDLPQKPRWVDGSGLSRYNLFTPNDMVFLLNKMYAEISFEKLKYYLPAVGESGTLKKWYGNDKPFVFAKSGALSNNYNLSGYIVTKKGTILIFSYMNNHYKIPTSQLKKEMEKLFLTIYNKY
tara:strand:- start:48555 stop:49832 length:1278 start_codon:yes stop_codon:yes gene_type:complete